MRYCFLLCLQTHSGVSQKFQVTQNSCVMIPLWGFPHLLYTRYFPIKYVDGYKTWKHIHAHKGEKAFCAEWHSSLFCNSSHCGRQWVLKPAEFNSGALDFKCYFCLVLLHADIIFIMSTHNPAKVDIFKCILCFCLCACWSHTLAMTLWWGWKCER